MGIDQSKSLQCQSSFRNESMQYLDHFLENVGYENIVYHTPDLVIYINRKDSPESKIRSHLSSPVFKKSFRKQAFSHFL